MVLKIRQAGEPVLRQAARPLSREDILSPEIQGLIELMRETMYDAPGVGLAAPQIGLSLQLAVIEDKPEYSGKLAPEQAAERGRRAVPFHVIINPKLTVVGSETADFFEGCLSLAGFAAKVRRALRIHVDCLNERAEPVSIDAEGWYARILQHEIGHLHGELYIDHMDSRTFTTTDNHSRHGKT